MSRRRAWSRREFLLLAAVFGASLLPRRGILAAWTGWGEPSSAPEVFASLMRQRASARVVGEAYLEATPSEADADVLVDAIVAGLEGGSVALETAGRDAATLRRRLARRVEQDFERGATVCLQGWILSRTEARLCALARLKLA